MHYRFQPGKKGISAKQLIESIGLQPADARLAFCSVDSVLVDKDDGSWKVRLKGPGELMPDAISAVREALRERMDHASIHISY
ncbi:MAG TPA: hypothetical protein PLT03_06995, partial [Bacillota bacterium]|nr:hypothetical protein [Bacillota bacterium]